MSRSAPGVALTPILGLLAGGLCACGGGGGSSAVPVALQVTPAAIDAPLGTSVQFAALCEFSNGRSRDVSTLAVWSSGDQGVATVDATGLARTHAQGATTITAAYEAVSQSAVLTVDPPELASIAVTPAGGSVFRGDTLQLAATGTFTDGSTQDLTGSVAWSSSNAAVATIDAAGLVTAVQTGTTTIRAASGAVAGTTELTVLPPPLASIAVTPQGASIARGLTLQYAALGTFTDGSTQDLTGSVAWSSADETVATITPAGLATALLAGVTTLRASAGTIQGEAVLTVRPEILQSIVVGPDAPLARGASRQLVATGHFDNATTQDLTSDATWASSDPLVASVEDQPPARGLAHAHAPGSATITASVGLVTGALELAAYLPLPRTGQELCWDELGVAIPCAGTGQDGELRSGSAWSAARHVLGTGAGAECVTDVLTGLMWARAPDGTTARAWLDALSTASGLTQCGFADWRLPTRRELRSLIHGGETSTANWLNGLGFSVLGTDYWTSSTLASIPANAWNTDMFWGVVDVYDKAGGPRLWVVRTADPAAAAAPARTGQTTCYDPAGTPIACAGTGQDGDLRPGVPWPEPRFVLGASVATDRLTGLTWERQPSAVPYTWQQALDRAASLVLDGTDDWRLPNVTELESLYHAGVTNGASWLVAQGFSGVQSSYYWTATSVAADPTDAWSVNMALGYVFFWPKLEARFAWAVRGP